MKTKLALVAAAILMAVPVMAQARLGGQAQNHVSGNYMEFRNADVYTGRALRIPKWV